MVCSIAAWPTVTRLGAAWRCWLPPPTPRRARRVSDDPSTRRVLGRRSRSRLFLRGVLLAWLGMSPRSLAVAIKAILVVHRSAALRNAMPPRIPPTERHPVVVDPRPRFALAHLFAGFPEEVLVLAEHGFFPEEVLLVDGEGGIRFVPFCLIVNDSRCAS